MRRAGLFRAYIYFGLIYKTEKRWNAETVTSSVFLPLRIPPTSHRSVRYMYKSAMMPSFRMVSPGEKRQWVSLHPKSGCCRNPNSGHIRVEEEEDDLSGEFPSMLMKTSSTSTETELLIYLQQTNKCCHNSRHGSNSRQMVTDENNPLS